MSGKQLTLAAGIKERFKSIDKYIPIEYTMRFIMAFLLSRVRIFEKFAPFGIAFSAAAPVSPAGLVTTIGAALGSLSCGDVLWALKYMGIMLLVRSAVRIFKNTPAGKLDIFAPAVTLFASMCIGGVYISDSGFELTPTVLYIVESFIAGGTAFFYKVSLAPWGGSDSRYDKTCRSVSVIILAGTLLMALAGVSLFGVLSIGRCFAVIFIMFCTFRGGIGLGCSCAAAIGAAMDLVSGCVPFFTMSYVFTAMLSGIFSKNGRLLFLLSYIAAGAISVMWTWGQFSMLPSLYETFAASVIFILIPDSALAKLGVFLPDNSAGFGFLKAREYTRDRVELTSDAFKSLFDTVKRVCEDTNTEDLSTIFDRASEQVCRSCPGFSRCWQKDYVDTVDIFNNITPRLSKNRRITEGDLPVRFAESCERVTSLVDAINAETRTFLCRRQYRQRLIESRGAAYNQYYDISAVLKNLSEELGGEIKVEPALERKLQKYLRGLNMDASTAIFRVRGGRLRAEISSKNLYLLKKDDEYLNKLSAVLGTRLCTSSERSFADRLVLLEAEPLSVYIGIATSKKAGETVSGDRGVYFRTDEGLLYVLLSDGMGSGEDASKISTAVTDILERFLKAGVAPEIALRILSDHMLLKNETEIESATIDLLCINMFSGESRIFKYGAAPSYLKKDGSVKRVNCSSLPAGLIPGSVGLKNVYAKLKLVPGSFAVLVSDGVTAGTDDKWLRDFLSDSQDPDPRELAAKIISSAKERSGCTDDMTALVLKIDARQ